MDCPICGTKISHRTNLKRHIIRRHDVSDLEILGKSLLLYFGISKDNPGNLSNTVLAPVKAADFFDGRTDLLLNFSAYFLFHAAQPGVGRLQVLGSKKS